MNPKKKQPEENEFFDIAHDSDNEIKPKTIGEWLESFFCSLGGFSWPVLKQYCKGHDRVVASRLGATVLVPFTMAVLAGSFTLSVTIPRADEEAKSATVELPQTTQAGAPAVVAPEFIKGKNSKGFSRNAHLAISLVGGLVWGFFILIIDLAIMPQLNKSVDQEDRGSVMNSPLSRMAMGLRKVLRFVFGGTAEMIFPLMRIGMAFILGALVSHVLLTAIFQERIYRHLEVEHGMTWKKTRTNYQTELVRWRDYLKKAASDASASEEAARQEFIQAQKLKFPIEEWTGFQPPVELKDTIAKAEKFGEKAREALEIRKQSVSAEIEELDVETNALNRAIIIASGRDNDEGAFQPLIDYTYKDVPIGGARTRKVKAAANVTASETRVKPGMSTKPGTITGDYKIKLDQATAQREEKYAALKAIETEIAVFETTQRETEGLRREAERKIEDERLKQYNAYLEGQSKGASEQFANQRGAAKGDMKLAEDTIAKYEKELAIADRKLAELDEGTFRFDLLDRFIALEAVGREAIDEERERRGRPESKEKTAPIASPPPIRGNGSSSSVAPTAGAATANPIPDGSVTNEPVTSPPPAIGVSSSSNSQPIPPSELAAPKEKNWLNVLMAMFDTSGSSAFDLIKFLFLATFILIDILPVVLKAFRKELVYDYVLARLHQQERQRFAADEF